MNLNPFNPKNKTWNASLNIFLYVKLIKENKNVDEISIDGYDDFKLRDNDVELFNEFLRTGDTTKINMWHSRNKDEVKEFKENFRELYTPKAVIWSDRNKTDYFEKKLQKGEEFQNYVENLFKEEYDLDLEPFTSPEGQYERGENKKGVEIKYDMMCKKTGNLYIEYAEKSSAGNIKYVNSGILKKDNSKYFLIGNYDRFWIFPKKILVDTYINEKEKDRKNRDFRFIKKKTSKGFLLPIKKAEKKTISISKVVKELRKVYSHGIKNKK